MYSSIKAVFFFKQKTEYELRISDWISDVCSSDLGIDRLRILGSDKATGRGTALAAGQHISDDIYVEIITDARGFTATQLEISLSKSLSVLSQAGSFGSSALNVRYKKDY